MSESMLEVGGMTCGHCEHAVTEELSRIPGVQAVDADASTGRVSVTHSLPADKASWEAAVQEAGFQVESWHISPDA